MFQRWAPSWRDRVRRSSTLVTALLQIPLLFGTPPDRSPEKTDTFRPDAFLHSARDTISGSMAPGAAFAVVIDGTVVWTGAVGLVEQGRPEKMSGQELFRIGDTSEILIALAILRLEEQGLLDVNDTVRSLLPDLKIENPWADTDPLRLVHLLEHTSGLEDLHLTDRILKGRSSESLRQRVLALDGPLRARWRPGSLVAYSRKGFALAALVIEQISGRSCETFITEEILQPLSMSTATFVPGKSLVPGHIDGNTAQDLGILLTPVEGLAATASDLAALVQLLLNQGRLSGREFFSAASIRQMLTPSSSLAARSGLLTGYGWAIKTGTYQGLLLRGLSGRSRGYRCRLEYFPAQGKGLVVLLNGDDDVTLWRLVETLRGQLVGHDSRPAVAASEIPPWRIASLCGYYRPVTPRLERERLRQSLLGAVRLELEGSSLHLAGGSAGAALIPITDRRFRLPDSPLPGAVFMSQDGIPFLIGTQAPFEGNFRAVSSWKLWAERILITVSLVLMGVGLCLACFRLVRRLLTRTRRPTPILVTLLPGVATLSFIAQLIVLNSALEDPLARLARLTPWSVALWLLGEAFLLLSIASVLACAFEILRSRFFRPHLLLSVACAIANLGLVVVLWSNSLLAVRTWT